MALKRCKRCGVERDESEFYWNSTASNGGNICKPCKRERDAAYRERNREAVRIASRSFYAQNSEYVREKNRESERALRLAVIRAYGSRCACCGETTPEFLTLDHPDNDGKAHRKATHGKIYADLRRRGFPSGYRLLCWNCNCARGRYGRCPHEVQHASNN